MRKATVSLSCMSVRQSRQHGTARLPMDGLSWNLILGWFFENLSRKLEALLKSDNNTYFSRRSVYIYDIASNSSMKEKFFRQVVPVSRVQKSLTGFWTRETCQWLKFPLNGLRPQNRVSPVVATFSLWTGMFKDGISYIPCETVIPLWLGRHFLVCENRMYHEKVRMTVG
jgi:hypothetical protein